MFGNHGVKRSLFIQYILSFNWFNFELLCHTICISCSPVSCSGLPSSLTALTSQSCTVVVSLWMTDLTCFIVMYYKGNSVFLFFTFLSSLCCPLILSPAERFKFSVNMGKKVVNKAGALEGTKKSKQYIVLIKMLTYVKFANRYHLN